MISAILLIIITILLPPVGVYLIAGCGADLLINILLTCLGYFPGHIHAFYLEYVYYHAQENGGNRRHGGVYSENVQTGGRGYGTVNNNAAAAPMIAPQEQGYTHNAQYAAPPQQQYQGQPQYQAYPAGK